MPETNNSGTTLALQAPASSRRVAKPLRAQPALEHGSRAGVHAVEAGRERQRAIRPSAPLLSRPLTPCRSGPSASASREDDGAKPLSCRALGRGLSLLADSRAGPG